MRNILIILSILVVLVCGVGTFVFSKMQAAKAQGKDALEKTAVVTRGDLTIKVIETGTIDAARAVEVKSRASGRLARLLVEEGDFVTQGQRIASIDPKETQLRVQQDTAQLRGATSAVERTSIEIEQRRRTAAADVVQAEARLAQLREEVKAQPVLTKSSIVAAQTSFETAQRELERLRTSAHPNARTSGESAVREAQANYDNAQRDLERQQALVKQGFVAGKAAEDAKLATDLARIRFESARDNLSRLESQLSAEMARAQDDTRRARAELDRALANQIQDVVKRKEFESAIASLQKTRAALRDVDVLRKSREQSQSTVVQLRSVRDESLRQLGETEIVSPLNGVVTKKLIQEGELVASLSSFSAGTPIVRIEDRDALRVLLNINEIDVAKLEKGMEAEIQVDAYPGETFLGEIRKIAPSSNGTGGTGQQGGSGIEAVVKYAVEIWMNKPDRRLRSGMSAKCTLIVNRRKNVFQLPAEYVGTEKNGIRFVKIIDSKSATAPPKKVIVKVGLSTGAMIEILSGVKEGDRVARPEFSGPQRKGFMQTGPDE